MSNAIEQGWVKSTDPRTGRTYYANRRTRKTQWEAPYGWVDTDDDGLHALNHNHNNHSPKTQNHTYPSQNNNKTQYGEIRNQSNSRDSSPTLPKNWEMMRDRKTGRPFYVDHVNKVTTWDPPKTGEKSNIDFSNLVSQPYLSQTKSNNSLGQHSNLYNNPTASDIGVNNLMPKQDRSSWGGKHSTSTSANFDSHTSSNSNIPPLDFSVVSVKDEARASCPSCHVFFSIPLKRRHHCRLCGDVFCDDCTSNRCLLPLDGPEFEKPVRVCDMCFSDISKGNYFSMRRYLAPLQLFDPNNAVSAITESNDQEGSGITETQVCAALAALVSDLNAVLMDATSFHEKISISSETLVPAITRHLHYDGTSDRAICALSTLLDLGKIVGDNSFAVTVHTQQGGPQVMDSILKLLERSGSSRHTLFFQEHAARAVFYLSDSDLLSKIAPEDQTLDLHRSLRNMLDHATCSVSPSLQRWAAACIRNLIIQDQHRTALYTNTETSYESFTSQLVNTGGVIILCSLIAAEDGDTRAHAISALSAVICAARDLNQDMVDADLVTAISNSGGCGEAISQLLLSSDATVAQMSVSFASYLIKPLLGHRREPMFAPSGTSYESKSEFLTPYCDAAIALVVEGDCLPALVQLISPLHSYKKKATLLDIQVRAMETLSSIAIACNSHPDTSSLKVKEAKSRLLSTPALPAAFEILSAASSQSLNSLRDSPHTRLREAAGLLIGQILMFDESDEAMNFLCVKKAAITFFTLAGDEGMFQPSGVLGEWAPRCLSWVEAAALLLTKVWYRGQRLLCKPSRTQQSLSQSPNTSTRGFGTETLDCLLEVIDAGAVQILSQIFSHKSETNSLGDDYLKIAACHNLAAMFGIAHGDDSNIAVTRLYDAVQASSSFSNGRQSRGGNNLIYLTLSFLSVVSRQVQQYNGEKNEAILHSLSEAALMAAGSVCGTFVGCNSRNNIFLDSNAPPIDFTQFVIQDEFSQKKENTCNYAGKILFSDFNPIPSMLVGVYGEGSIAPALRLAHAIALYGSSEVRPKLATCLIPVCDILRQALVDGNRYIFTSTIALVRYCGPYVTSEPGMKRELMAALRLAIKTLASVLSVAEMGYEDGVQMETLRFLKENCIFTFESLSSNQALWTSIAMGAFGPIAGFLSANDEWDEEDVHRRKILCAVLTTVKNVITLPSHAVAACNAGIAAPLARLVCGKKEIEDGIDKRTRDGRRRALKKERIRRENKIEFDVKTASLELLHTLASTKEARQCGLGLLNSGVIGAACFALGGSTEGSEHTFNESKGSDSLTRIGLEIIHFILSDLENPTLDENNVLLWSAESKSFVDQVARQSRFIRALCATMLLSWMNLGYNIHSISGSTAQTNPSEDGTENFEFVPLYGPSLVTYDGTCAGYPDSMEAAVALLFSIASLCSSVDAGFSEAFWDTFFMKEDRALVNAGSKKETSVTACSVFLSILMDEEEGYCVPHKPEDEKFFFSHSLPTVRERLIDGLCSNFSDVFNEVNSTVSDDDTSLLAILKRFQVPSICMILCGTSPSLRKPAFHLIQGMTSSFPDEILPHMVSDETSLQAALDMLNYETDEDENGAAAQIRLLFAKIICVSATKGILGPSLERFGLRSRAIASLSAACKIDEGEVPKYCLKSLVTIFSSVKGSLQLSHKEARTIAKTLGGIISSMVLERFAKRATEHNSHDSISNDDLIEEEPEVKLLCSLASYKEALSELCHVGGLEAISLVSSDGVPSAILAMHEVVKDDSSVILDIEGHISVMDVLNTDSHQETSSYQVLDEKKRFRTTKVSFDFLTALCKSSASGRKAVSDASSCRSCIQTASEIIRSCTQKLADTDNNRLSLDKESKDDRDCGDELSGSISLSRRQTADENIETDRKMAAIAAISFLSELAHAKSSRVMIFHDSHLLQFLVSLGRECFDSDIVVQSTELLTSLAPYAGCKNHDGQFSSSFFASIFCDILGRSDLSKNNALKKKKTSLRINSDFQLMNSNSNQIFASAVAGLECVFDEIQLSEKSRVYDDLCDHMVRLTDEISKSVFSKQKPSGRMIAKNSGLLASNITTLLLVWCCSESDSIALIKPEFLSALLQLIILHSLLEKQLGSKNLDAGNVVDSDEMCFVTAARTQSLQFISSIMRNTTLQESLHISWTDMILNVKARLEQRKYDYLGEKTNLEGSCDFTQVLDLICESKSDKVAAVHALRMKERLGW